MNKKLIIIFVVIMILVVLGFIIYGFSKTNKMPSYSKDDANRPIAEVKEDSFDFGPSNTSDVQEHTFPLKNIGKSDLYISQITTSCDCTSAYVYQGGNVSPRFNMHIESSWKTAVKPDETVYIRAVYDPKVMPEKGKISRFITMASNDPNQPELQYKIEVEIK